MKVKLWVPSATPLFHFSICSRLNQESVVLCWVLSPAWQYMFHILSILMGRILLTKILPGLPTFSSNAISSQSLPQFSQAENISLPYLNSHSILGFHTHLLTLYWLFHCPIMCNTTSYLSFFQQRSFHIVIALKQTNKQKNPKNPSK